MTLIETIVVVTILLVLAAIVVPLGARAVHRGKIASSMSKVKQLQLAASIYRTDYDGDAVYGSVFSMGLPHFSHGSIIDLLGVPESLMQSTCGNHPSIPPRAVLNITYMVDDSPQFAADAALYQTNLILFADMNCTDAEANLRNPYESKLGIGVLLGGNAILRRKPGIYRGPGWWADPPL